jgi:hypothetical protein
VLSLTALYVPALHGAQRVAAAAALNVPGAQGRQDKPLGPKVPAAQGRQEEETPGENPAGHERAQKLAPAGLYVPAPQGRHADALAAPGALLKVPAGQELHTSLPAALQKPARQQVPAPALLFFTKAAEQMLHEAAPLGLNVPAGQVWQKDRL